MPSRRPDDRDSAREPRAAHASHDSLAARLERQFGSDVYPELSLDESFLAKRREESERVRASTAQRDAEPDADVDVESPNRSPSSGGSGSSRLVLDRLSKHRPVASRYKVLRPLARGGMGEILEVFDEDLRRELAMKVVLDRKAKSKAPDTPRDPSDLEPRLLTRFLEEAQITGQLDHPGVVPVHELGLSDDGQVYFTMQLVRGRDLEAVFDLAEKEEEGWSLTRAVGTLHKACEAVAYAHSKGVIHRDLKPANVMVGNFGEVYVMDWGLARVLGYEDNKDVRIHTARLDDAADDDPDALLTMDGDIIGTPAYMAPEQASGKVGAVDVRTDVYAIGAMLYRLLAGTSPYVPHGATRRASQILRDLLDAPPKPIDSITSHVPVELAAICEKAMARDPDERYATVADLADDLRAFLEGRVVGAYATGCIAETKKWIRRNKPLAASLAATVIALVAGLCATWTLKHRADENATLAEQRRFAAMEAAADADRQRDIARLAATAAERQAAIAAAVNEFLNQDLLAAVTPEERGVDITVREVLGRAADELDGKFPDQPDVEAELRMTIARSLQSLGEYARSIPHYERAWRLRRDHAGENDTATLVAMRGYGGSLRDAAHYNDSRTLLESVCERSRDAFGPDAADTLAAERELALTLELMGSLDDAGRLYESILERQSASFGRDDPETLRTIARLGNARLRQGRLDEADALLEEAYRRSLESRGALHPDTLATQSNYALILTNRGDYEESERLFLEVVEAQREVFGEDHPIYATALQNLSRLYWDQGRYEEAARAARDAVETARRSVGEDHPSYFGAFENLMVTRQAKGDFDEMLRLHSDLVEGKRDAYGKDHPATLLAESNRIVLFLNAGRLDDAEEQLRDLLPRMDEVIGPDHPNALSARENLGNVMYRKGDIEASAELTLQVLEGRRRTYGSDHPKVARTLLNLGFVRQRAGQIEEAIGDFREARERYVAAVGARHPDAVTTTTTLGNALIAAGEFDEARATFQAMIDEFEGVDDPPDEVGFAHHQIAITRFRQDDLDGAIEALLHGVEELRRIQGPDANGTLTSQAFLRDALIRQERYAEAEPYALDLLERHESVSGARHRETRDARRRLIALYESWGKPEEADRWR